MSEEELPNFDKKPKKKHSEFKRPKRKLKNDLSKDELNPFREEWLFPVLMSDYFQVKTKNATLELFGVAFFGLRG